MTLPQVYYIGDVMTKFKLAEAIELLKAIVAYRERRLSSDDDMARSAQMKMVSEIRDVLGDFEIDLESEARNE